MTNKKIIKQADELYLKGNAFNDRGDYGLAEEAFLKALVYYTKATEWEKVVACEMSIGNVCCNKNRFEDAVEHWGNALKIYEQSNLFTEAGELCLTIGDLYYDQKNNWASGHYYEKAKAFFQKDLGKNELNFGVSCQKLGNVYYQIGQLESAESSYNAAVPSLKKFGSMLGNIGEIYQAIGHIHMNKPGSGELDIARSNFACALDIFQQLKMDDKVQEVGTVLQTIQNQEKQRKLERKVKELEKIVKPTGYKPKESLAYSSSDSDFSDFETENVRPKQPPTYAQAKFIPTSAQSFVAPKAPKAKGVKSPESKKHYTHVLNNMSNQMQYDEVAKANKIKL